MTDQIELAERALKLAELLGNPRFIETRRRELAALTGETKMTNEPNCPKNGQAAYECGFRIEDNPWNIEKDWWMHTKWEQQFELGRKHVAELAEAAAAEKLEYLMGLHARQSELVAKGEITAEQALKTISDWTY